MTPFSRSHKGLDCWKMACLHPVSRRNGWILTKLAQLYCCELKKYRLGFGDIDSILKVTVGLRLLENGFFAPYLQNEWMNFDQTCTALLLRQGQELFKVTGGSDCWKMACLHPISRMNGWILTKLVHLYCCDMEKNWLDFGDHGPIFKVTQGLRLLKNGLSAPCLMKEWMDFDQTCTTILLWIEKELIRFCWPHFKGQRRARIVGKWIFCTPSPEWMDGFWPNLYSFIVETGTRTD